MRMAVIGTLLCEDFPITAQPAAFCSHPWSLFLACTPKTFRDSICKIHFTWRYNFRKNKAASFFRVKHPVTDDNITVWELAIHVDKEFLTLEFLFSLILRECLTPTQSLQSHCTYSTQCVCVCVGFYISWWRPDVLTWTEIFNSLHLVRTSFFTKTAFFGVF